MAKDLVVRIVGDASSFNRSVDSATKKTSKFGVSIGGLAKGGVITAAATGVALITKSLFDSVGKAKEAQDAQVRLQSALKNVGVSYKEHGKQIDDAIQKTSRLAGIDDEDLSDAFSKLVRTTGSVTKATQGMNLAADIAAARHISLEQASKAVEKAMNGQTRGLKSMGVEIDKGTTSTEALERAQAQFAGAAEEHGRTAAGAQDKLGVAFENLQEKVGEKVLPVLAKLSLKLVDLIDWSEKNWPKFKEAAEPVFNAVKAIIDNTIDKIKAIVDTIQGVIKIIKGIKDGDWGLVWSGIKEVVIQGIGGMLSALVALPAKVLEALGKKAWSGLSAIGGWIKDAIVSGLEGIGRGIISFIEDAINSAIDLLNKAIGVYNAIPIAPNIDKVSHIGGPGEVTPGARQPRSGRASGGPVMAGVAYTVGERGRELFVPNEAGRIIPNNQLDATDAGGMATFNISLGGEQVATILWDQMRQRASVFEKRNGRSAF